MKTPLDHLKYEELVKINKIYLEEHGSLNTTAAWINETYDLENKVNRQHLSHIFHSQGLEVRSPNGKPQGYFRDTTEFATEYGEFAKDNVALLWSDIREYLETGENRIDYLSACVMLGTDFYVRCIGTINRGVERLLKWEPDVYPVDISELQIIEAREQYERAYEYWFS